jgi:FkbM family methyltransferase
MNKIRHMIFVCIINPIAKIFGAIVPYIGGNNRGILIDRCFSIIRNVDHNDISMKFVVPNGISEYRTNTFSTKEPETLAWIDEFDGDGVFWDIGANVGIYSIYCAKKHPRMRVIAFEPSVMNLELLAKNIAINDVETQVSIFPVALFQQSGINEFSLGNFDRGGALSAFGVDFGFDGKSINKAISYNTIGVSMDDAISIFNIESPNYIKIDVDGIEHIILRGGPTILKNSSMTSLLVEVNDNFEEQRDEIVKILSSSGLLLKIKTHAAMFDNGKWSSIYNNIWRRC